MQSKKIFLILLIIQIIACPVFISGVQTINAQTIEKDTVLANKHFETGEEYFNNKTYDTAAVNFEKASILYEKHNLWLKYLLSETKHGECYQKQWQLDQAIIIIKPAIEKTIAQISKNDTIVADAFHILGVQYYYQSKLDSVLPYWIKLLEIRKELFGEKHASVASSYNNIGLVYMYKSEYSKALQYYFKDIEIKKELFGEKHIKLASSYTNIGIVYWYKSEYDKALEYYFKSLEIKKELIGEKHVSLARLYNNIGIIYHDKSEYDKAIQYFFKSLEILKEIHGEKHNEVANSYNNIGSTYLVKTEYDKALEYCFKSLEITKELLGKKNIDVAGSYINIGRIYNDKLQLDKALEYYFTGLNIAKEVAGKNHQYVVNAYHNIGILYANKEEYNLALDFFQKEIASCVRNFNDTINVKSIPIIKDYLNWDDLLKALHEKAEIFADTTKTLQGFQNLERLKLALRHYQAADTLISLVRQDITTKSDKLSLGEQASKIYKGAVDVCIKLSDTLKVSDSYYYKEQAFYFSERNKSSVLLEALAGAEALQYAGIPDTLLQIEQKLNIDIANYSNLKNNEKNDSIANIWSDRLFKTNRSYDSLIVVFETQYPDYYNLKYNNSPVSVPQLSKLLDKKTAMLSYFVGDSTITIFAIKKSPFRGLRGQDFVVCQVTKPDSLNKWINYYRTDISETNILADEVAYNTHWSVDEYKELASRLYNLLFPAEIQEFLKGGMFYDIENLIIIPDGQLATLPFETLLTEEYNVEWTDWKNKAYFSEMPYLIKDYAISYSYSATLFYNTFSTEKQNDIEVTTLEDWLAFAPVFDGVKSTSRLANGNIVASLPGTETEVTTISELFENNEKKAKIKLFNEANENAVKSNELQNYKILHFATHGFVNTEKPELSGIVLAQDTTIKFEGYEDYTGNIAHQNDGILYQSEIYNLKLNCDLIVLSACETGLGKITSGEGVIGLTRALLYAGTDNIIVSLWAVSDKSTAELMVKFYENLLNEKPYKVSKDLIRFNAPLRDAKLKMIEEGKYAHPYFWSPFILIGE